MHGEFALSLKFQKGRRIVTLGYNGVDWRTGPYLAITVFTQAYGDLK
jgi:hypothetical protein